MIMFPHAAALVNVAVLGSCFVACRLWVLLPHSSASPTDFQTLALCCLQAGDVAFADFMRSGVASAGLCMHDAHLYKPARPA